MILNTTIMVHGYQKIMQKKFDWYNAENIARELKLDGINVIIESK